MTTDGDDKIDWERFRAVKKKLKGKTLAEIIFDSHALSEKLASTAKRDSEAGIKLAIRFQKALTTAGHTVLAKRISKCAFGRRCGSTYCPDCRSNLGKALRQRTERNIVRRFGGKPDRILANVVHVTGHMDIASIDAGQIRPLIYDERNFFQSLIKDRPWLRIEGAFELELLHFAHMDRMGSEYSPEKKKQSESLLKGTLTRHMYGDEEMVVYIHWHALVAGLDDIKGRGYFSTQLKHSAREVLKKRYSGHRHLHVQPLYPETRQALKKSLAKISSYPFKDAYRLKYSFDGADNKYGEYIDMTTLGHFINVYRQVGGVRNAGLAISYRHKRASSVESSDRPPLDILEHLDAD